MLIGNERNAVEQMPAAMLNGSGTTSEIVEKKIEISTSASLAHTCVAY